MCFRSQRHLDREHTAVTRDVADGDITVLCSNRLARDGKPEPQPGPIFPSPLSERFERIALRLGDAAALVLDFDPHLALLRTRPDRDAATRWRVLEPVGQKIHQRGLEELP